MKKKQASAPLKQQLVSVYRKAVVKGVPLVDLEEKIESLQNRLESSSGIEETQDSKRTKRLKRRLPPLVRFGAFVLPVLFICAGLVLIFGAVGPVVIDLFSRDDAQLVRLETPIPQTGVLDVTPLVIDSAKISDKAVAEYAGNSSTEPITIDSDLDYTDLTNWFDGFKDDGSLKEEFQEDSYIVDIPSIEVENAQVEIGGTNLDKSLIAYPGTAKPGEPGAPVIFGHSVLRQFYNPSEKNTRRYNSIFTRILELNKGDKIYVTSGGVKYTYIVQSHKEVKPEDVEVLSQDYSSHQIKLITCTPLGTAINRWVVTAQLVSSNT